jgi:exopolysaccharide/PEP-CTERM locus tyrosine autokinase
MSIIEKAAKRLAEKEKNSRVVARETTSVPLNPDTTFHKSILTDQAPIVQSKPLVDPETRKKDISSDESTETDKIFSSGVDDHTTEDQKYEDDSSWKFSDIDSGDNDILRITEIGKGFLLSPDGGRTRTAEEFRIIKRPLLVKAFSAAKNKLHHPNLIGVTSAVQSEGKTFISLNLAISIAMEMDSTVLLVDADVAKPGLSTQLGITDRPGLIEQLAGEVDNFSDLLLRTDIPKLTVLPAGNRHKRSTELLASIKMRRLLEEMASRYADRIVLFDSPPLLESTEASVLASQMGQVALVVASDHTSQMVVKEAVSQLESLENLSLVLNKCKENIFSNFMSGKYGGYGYGYGYGYGLDLDK